MAEGSDAKKERADHDLRQKYKEDLRNYRFSFKFSQGSTEQQDLLLLYVAMHLQDKEIRRILSNKNKLLEDTARMSIPREHVKNFDNDPREDLIKRGDPMFRHVLEGYLTLLEEVRLGNPRTAPTESGDIDICAFYKGGSDTLVREILLRALQSDAMYIARGRPNRETLGMDPFESYVRTFALNSEPTHSTVFDKLFREMSAVLRGVDASSNPSYKLEESRTPLQPLSRDIADNLLVERVTSLVSVWEETHPGKKFFMPDLTVRK